MKIFRLHPFLCFLISILFVSCQCNRNSTSKSAFGSLDEDSALLLFTTNIRGEVEPCGCTADPLGGLSRMAYLVNDAQTNQRDKTLFVDAGNLLFAKKQKAHFADLCQDEKRIDLILSTYHHLGITGTIRGPYDEARGNAFYNNKIREHGISLLNEHPLSSQLIIKSGIRIGLIGLLEKTESISEQIQKAVPYLKNQGAQIIVVVAQIPTVVAKKTLSSIFDIDVVILGQELSEVPILPYLENENGPWFISAGMQGQYLGVIEFRNVAKRKRMRFALDDREAKKQARYRLLSSRFNALQKQTTEASFEKKKFLEEQLKGISSEMLAMKKELPDSILESANIKVRAIPIKRETSQLKLIAEKLEAYEQAIPMLVKQCEKNMECESAKPGQPVYVGMESCRKCHAAAVQVWENAMVQKQIKNDKGEFVWRKLGHVNAWQTLREKNKEEDRNCVGCHSVGFMEPGGYCKVSEVGFRINVQCESCHGPGSRHAETGDKKWITKKADEKLCRSCHHVPHISTSDSFIYDEKVKLILGKGHGEDLLRKLDHGKIK